MILLKIRFFGPLTPPPLALNQVFLVMNTKYRRNALELSLDIVSPSSRVVMVWNFGYSTVSLRLKKYGTVRFYGFLLFSTVYRI